MREGARAVGLWVTHAVVQGFGDELALAVDAGEGALPGDLLLLLGDAAGRGGAAARVQRAWGGRGVRGRGEGRGGGGGDRGARAIRREKETPHFLSAVFLKCITPHAEHAP